MARPAHLSACALGGTFAAVALDDTGAALWECEIDIRAHDVVADPAQGICVVMGRKPGRAAYLCDLATGVVRRELAPLSGHTFDGHAIFTADRNRLLTTQSADASQAGNIVAYDVVTGAMAGRFSSHGIEPHELIWAAPDILAIGNGGILDRRSADAIDSSLVLVDACDGSLIRRWVMDDEWETLSIRHLARLPGDRIVFAMQDQDAATDLRPLVGIAGLDGTLAFLDIPADIQRRLDGYIGSVAVDADGAFIAASAPRGGAALFWSAADHRYLGKVDLADVCGLAATRVPGAFHLSSGHGMMRQVRLDAAQGVVDLADVPAASALAVQWDNHLSRA